MHESRSSWFRCQIEEINHARLQRVLRSDDEEAVVLNQLLQNLGAVTQVIHRRPDIGAHCLLDQGFRIAPDVAGEDALDRRANAVDNRLKVARLVFRRRPQLFERCENGPACRAEDYDQTG